MKIITKKIAIVVLSIFILCLVLILTGFFFPTFRDSNNKIVNGSVAEISTIELGGIEQTIMIRGKDENSPILLFLHGGPGYPFMSYARKFQSNLEQNFIVVNWDQRGCG